MTKPHWPFAERDAEAPKTLRHSQTLPDRSAPRLRCTACSSRCAHCTGTSGVGPNTGSQQRSAGKYLAYELSSASAPSTALLKMLKFSPSSAAAAPYHCPRVPCFIGRTGSQRAWWTEMAGKKNKKLLAIIAFDVFFELRPLLKLLRTSRGGPMSLQSPWCF